MLQSARVIAFVELVGFVSLAILSKLLLSQIIWRFAGPISLIGVLIILTIYMRARGESWAQNGLPPLKSTKSKLLVIPQTLLTFFAFAIAVGSVLFVADIAGLSGFDERPAGVDARWGDIEGNLSMLLLWIAIGWVAAGFGEEMFFRGFLITRMLRILKGAPFSAVFAVLLPALFFGWGHMYYQGMRGLLMTSAIAIAFGTVFLLNKRNLWPIILVHGAVDTIGFLATYFDWDV